MIKSGGQLDASQQYRNVTYNDINSLNKIKSGSREDEELALRQVAEQFEAMFLNLMLKSMRDANDQFGKDSPLNSNETKFYQSMLDQEVSVSMASQRGIGLADVLVGQLSHFQKRVNMGLENNGSGLQDAQTKNPEIKPTAKALKVSNYGQPTASSDGIKQSGFDSPESFVKTLYPHAVDAAKKLGVDPKVLIAQAALETGWGQKIIHSDMGSSNNLFNIKADSRWSGGAVSVNTTEFYEGKPLKQNAQFRAYNSIEDSFKDYVEFLNTNDRYKSALEVAVNGRDDMQFVKELQKAGYATDPEYSNKINRVLDSKALEGQGD